MLRGGQCLPAARERVHGAPRQHFGPDPFHGFGFRAGSWTPGGNPPSLDLKCCRVGSQPGQGFEPLALGLRLQGTLERGLLWLVKRSGVASENATPVGSELETLPTSKHWAVFRLLFAKSRAIFAFYSHPSLGFLNHFAFFAV